MQLRSEDAGSVPGPADKRPSRVRRRLFLLAAVAVLVVSAAIAVTVLTTRGSKTPDQLQVAERVRTAIGAAAGEGATSPFDTRTLRTTLETELRGWVIDLATTDDRRRLGVAARRLSDSTCVFAWSDVGSARSATVTDPALPCLADIALVPAKNAA